MRLAALSQRVTYLPFTVPLAWNHGHLHRSTLTDQIPIEQRPSMRASALRRQTKLVVLYQVPAGAPIKENTEKNANGSTPSQPSRNAFFGMDLLSSIIIFVLFIASTRQIRRLDHFYCGARDRRPLSADFDEKVGDKNSWLKN